MHIPVLQEEVIRYLDPKPNENFIDCTVGEAGHTFAILEKIGLKGKILGIETDYQLYKKLKAKEIKNNLILVNDSYVNLKEIVKKENFWPVAGILFDLGMSSWHLEKSGKGFSFLRNEPLDMRYKEMKNEKRKTKNNNLTAREIINQWTEKEIWEILREYGEERFAKRIAKKIIEQRKISPIKTTFQLKEIIKQATPPWYHHKRLHFATKTFQALRIAVNNELDNLRVVLPQTLEVLESGGRLAVISFHSLEDRIVKNFLRDNLRKGILKILTKKPVRPSEEEIKINPRSRSAKLRVAIKSIKT